MKKLLAAIALLIGSAASVQAAFPFTGYVQTNPPIAPQPGAFNISSGTVGQIIITGLPANQCLQTGPGGLVTTTGVNCLPAVSSPSALAIELNSVIVTSPTVAINFLGPPFLLTSVGSTGTIKLDGSSVTLQGIITAASLNALATSSATATYLQISSAIVTYAPISGSNNYIQNTSSLQSGATFYTSSGTVNGNFYASSITVQNPSLYNSIVAFNAQGLLISTTVTGGGGGGNSNFPGVQSSGNSIITTTTTLIGGSGISLTQSGSTITVTATGGAASSLGTAFNGVSVSSPTSGINVISPLVNILVGSTPTFSVDLSTIAPASGSNNYIQNTSALQSNATFYVSSGTVQQQLIVGPTNPNGLIFPTTTEFLIQPQVQTTQQGNLTLLDEAGLGNLPRMCLNVSSVTASEGICINSASFSNTLSWSQGGTVGTTLGNGIINFGNNGNAVNAVGGKGILDSPSGTAIEVVGHTKIANSFAVSPTAVGGPYTMTISTTGTVTFSSAVIMNGQLSISSTVLLNGSAGSNGQFLTSGGAGTVPTWTTSSGGGASTLATAFNGVRVTSPTVGLNFISPLVATANSSTATVSVDLSTTANAVAVAASTAAIVPNLLASTNTWTGQETWASPQPSTFTYGVTAGSLTLTGSGNAQVTENGLTGQVVLSTGVPTNGQLPVFGASMTVVATGLTNSVLAVNGSGVLVSTNPVMSISTTTLGGTPLTGAVYLLPGSNITETLSGSSITFASSGGGGGGSGIVSPGTFTWTNNFGVQLSTLSIITPTSIAQSLYIGTSTVGVPSLTVSTNAVISIQGNSADAEYLKIKAGAALAQPAIGFYDINGTEFGQFKADTNNNDIQLASNSGVVILASNGTGMFRTQNSNPFMTLRGNMAIGTSYFNQNAPTDGAIIQGQTGIGTLAPPSNARLTSIGDTTADVYSFVASTSTSLLQVAISTNAEIVVNGSTGTSGQFLSSQGPGLPVKWVSGGAGTVTSVTGTAPINVTAGATPVVSLSTVVPQNETFTSSVTINGPLSMSSNLINNVTNPVSAQDAATKNYVDTSVLATDWRAAAIIASNAALPANTYSNGASGVGATLTEVGFGALTVDGYAVQVNDRVLVKNEILKANNGIYTVSATGGGAASYILIRATDFNQTSEVVTGASLFITSGTVNSDTGWVMISSGTTTMGTSPIVFAQFTGGGDLIANNGITESFNTISVSSVSLSSQVVGNLPVTNLNSGTSASGSTFWRGDGTWAAPSGGGGGIVSPGTFTWTNNQGITGSTLTFSTATLTYVSGSTISFSSATFVNEIVNSTAQVLGGLIYPTSSHDFGRSDLAQWFTLQAQQQKPFVSGGGNNLAIFALGDSHLTTGGILNGFMDWMNTNFGLAGTWITLSTQSFSTNAQRPNGFTFGSSSGTWSSLKFNSAALGFDDDQVHTTGIGSNLTATGPGSDRVFLHYVKQPNGGTISFTVDSGTPHVLATANATTAVSSDVYIVGNYGVHTASISYTATGTAGVDALDWVFYSSSTPGNVVYSVGSNSMRLFDHQQQSQPNLTTLASLMPVAPQIILFESGVNEAADGDTPASMIGYAHTLMATFRAAWPNAGCAYMSPPDFANSNSKTYPISQYALAWSSAAINDGCAYIDFNTYFSSEPFFSSYYQGDGIHLNTQGAFVASNIVINTLSNQAGNITPFTYNASSGVMTWGTDISTTPVSNISVLGTQLTISSGVNNSGGIGNNLTISSSNVFLMGSGQNVIFSSAATHNGNLIISSAVTLSNGVGSNGQFITSGGVGAAPTWTSSAGALLASTQVWTGGNTFQSTTTHSGSVTFSSNVVLGNGQGVANQVFTTGVGGVPTWTTPAAGSASVLAVTTGSVAGFNSLASSPTAVINFDSTTFKASLQGGATAFVTTVIPAFAPNILIPFGNYGTGLQTNLTVTLSSAVPACEELITPNSVLITTVTFFQGTNASSHVAVGFYDNTCTKLSQSTATLVGNGFQNTVFTVPFAMTGGTKYFMCVAVDAPNLTFYASPADREGYVAAMSNTGESTTNLHVFKAGNASTDNTGPAVVLPSTCGTRTTYANGTAGTFGMAVH